MMPNGHAAMLTRLLGHLSQADADIAGTTDCTALRNRLRFG
jgi:hypothetical protein